MRILGRFRGRAGRVRPERDAQPGSTGDLVAISHYDRLSEKKLIAELAHLSRAELAEVEAYERSHRARPAVLERLHYARQGGVDAATAKAVGDFERRQSSRQQAEEVEDERDALRQEARYHRERLELYRAKLYGGRAVNQSKLRDLERAADDAAARLKRAEGTERADGEEARNEAKG